MRISNIQGKWQLNNGVEMPYFGLGVFQTRDGAEVKNAIHYALEAGYRHIDTAAIYNNERGVGEAIRESTIDRKDIFVTSKVWNSEQRADNTLKAFDATMERLGLDYLDLYLIHWPVVGKYKNTWKILEQLYREGRVNAIGVSNFLVHHLKDLLTEAEIVPMVNQVEFHPWLVQQELTDFCKENKIQFEAWSPLMQGHVVNVPEIKEIARNYGKTPVQLVLRWNLQKDVITIPKSVKKERIISNAEIFDFEISGDDMKKIDNLDRNKRFGAHPDNFGF